MTRKLPVSLIFLSYRFFFFICAFVATERVRKRCGWEVLCFVIDRIEFFFSFDLFNVVRLLFLDLCRFDILNEDNFLRDFLLFRELLRPRFGRVE